MSLSEHCFLDTWKPESRHLVGGGRCFAQVASRLAFDLSG